MAIIFVDCALVVSFGHLHGLPLPSSAFLCLLESYSGVRCHGPHHFFRYLIELCRYRVLYSFWDSGGAEGRAVVFALSGAHFVV